MAVTFKSFFCFAEVKRQNSKSCEIPSGQPPQFQDPSPCRPVPVYSSGTFWYTWALCRLRGGAGAEPGWRARPAPPSGLPWLPAPHGQMLTCPFLPTTPPDTTISDFPGSPASKFSRHRKSALSALPGAPHPFRDKGAELHKQSAYWLEFQRVLDANWPEGGGALARLRGE